jgi:hypothetical protein
MPNVLHSSLTGTNDHEPKGAAAAVANTAYVADGAGSGDWKYLAGMAYGQIQIVAGATTQTLSAASAYAKLDPGTAWGNGVTLNTTLGATDGQITVGIAGVYEVSFTVVFTTASLAAGTTYSFKVAVNGTPASGFVSVDKITAGADDMTAQINTLVTLAANDIVSVHVAGDGTSSSTLITAKEAVLKVVLLKAS